jgi:hypothetical protein
MRSIRSRPQATGRVKVIVVISHPAPGGELMRFYRMTTRRWIIAVAIVAFLSSVGIQAAKWTRYARDVREYKYSEQVYGEGRATMLSCVTKSRQLMESRLALCAFRAGEIAVIEAHLDRVVSLIERETDEPERLHDDLFLRFPEINDARESQVECYARLDALMKTR